LQEIEMRYQVLATDYDGTLAKDGSVDDQTIAALKRFLATGRRLLMITGRELPELLEVFPHPELFEWIVAENGGLLYRPSTKETKRLAEPPSAKFVQSLRDHEVSPLSVGEVIVATFEPHEKTVLDVIRDLGLEMQVIFNKGAVMVLPPGINKASGLEAALREMGASPHNTVGVGDAENDHAFLRLCEVSVAVSNALPAVKDTADFVTGADRGAGVVQLIDRIIEDDLDGLNQNLQRHFLALGKQGDQEIGISPYGRSVLICGPSASGKSTVASRLIESLQEHNYQFCLIDPEGDYQNLEGAVVFGGPQSPPAVDEVLRLLEDPQANAVVGMSGMQISDRPALFLDLLSQLLQMRSRTGRPHWIVLDEAHHLMPAEWRPADGTLPGELHNFLLITVHPELLAPTLLSRLNTVMILGTTASETLEAYSKAVEQEVPAYDHQELKQGELLLWRRDTDEPPTVVQVHPCQMERQRHSRKYAVGELPPDRSFYFRGPDGKMNLRAQNLMLFLQLADGVDDETWDFHLKEGDYSHWFQDCIKDDNLAAVAKRIEGLQATPQESRSLIRAAVEQDYTLPASPMPVAGAS
jgi:hydroxymethylpyrimidine pyrophosphatase-like HAD family hydrolase/GTPase SAR1 family protein